METKSKNGNISRLHLVRVYSFRFISIFSNFPAMKTNSVNLGQGFPDWNPPEFIKKVATHSINEESNQYTRSLNF
jgi:aspartate/methionine/tyrosine aminotransferase